MCVNTYATNRWRCCCCCVLNWHIFSAIHWEFVRSQRCVVECQVNIRTKKSFPYESSEVSRCSHDLIAHSRLGYLNLHIGTSSDLRLQNRSIEILGQSVVKLSNAQDQIQAHTTNSRYRMPMPINSIISADLFDSSASAAAAVFAHVFKGNKLSVLISFLVGRCCVKFCSSKTGNYRAHNIVEHRVIDWSTNSNNLAWMPTMSVCSEKNTTSTFRWDMRWWLKRVN